MNKAKLKAAYDGIAEGWFEEHQNDNWYAEVTGKLIGVLPKGAAVLDVGCAQGSISNLLSENGSRVTGIDFSEEMIRLAKKRFPDLEFEVFDMYDLGGFPGVFDCVVASAVLLHVPRKDILPVMRLLKNKVKPGGFLYVAVKAPKNGKTEEISREIVGGKEFERFFSYFTQEEIEGYFKKLGFKIILSDQSVSGRATWVQVIGKLS